MTARDNLSDLIEALRRGEVDKGALASLQSALKDESQSDTVSLSASGDEELGLVQQQCLDEGLIGSVAAGIGAAKSLTLDALLGLVQICRSLVGRVQDGALLEDVPLLRVAVQSFLQENARARDRYDRLRVGKEVLDELQGLLVALPDDMRSTCPALRPGEARLARANLAIQFLRMERLEQKVDGIVELAQIASELQGAGPVQEADGVICIDMEEDFSKTPIANALPSPSPASKKSASQACLSILHLAKEQRLLMLLLDDNNLHPEIVRRSAPVIRFFVELGGLDEEVIQRMWAAAGLQRQHARRPNGMQDPSSDHAERCKLLLRLLTEFSADLTADQVERLRLEVARTPMTLVDSDVLQLVMRLESLCAATGGYEKTEAKLVHLACYGGWEHNPNPSLQIGGRHSRSESSNAIELCVDLLHDLCSGIGVRVGGLATIGADIQDPYRNAVLHDLRSIASFENSASLSLRSSLCAWHLITAAFDSGVIHRERFMTPSLIKAWWKYAPILLTDLSHKMYDIISGNLIRHVEAWLTSWWSVPVWFMQLDMLPGLSDYVDSLVASSNAIIGGVFEVSQRHDGALLRQPVTSAEKQIRQLSKCNFNGVILLLLQLEKSAEAGKEDQDSLNRIASTIRERVIALAAQLMPGIDPLNDDVEEEGTPFDDDRGLNGGAHQLEKNGPTEEKHADIEVALLFYCWLCQWNCSSSRDQTDSAASASRPATSSRNRPVASRTSLLWNLIERGKNARCIPWATDILARVNESELGQSFLETLLGKMKSAIARSAPSLNGHSQGTALRDSTLRRVTGLTTALQSYVGRMAPERGTQLQSFLGSAQYSLEVSLRGTAFGHGFGFGLGKERTFVVDPSTTLREVKRIIADALDVKAGDADSNRLQLMCQEETLQNDDDCLDDVFVDRIVGLQVSLGKANRSSAQQRTTPGATSGGDFSHTMQLMDNAIGSKIGMVGNATEPSDQAPLLEFVDTILSYSFPAGRHQASFFPSVFRVLCRLPITESKIDKVRSFVAAPENPSTGADQGHVKDLPVLFPSGNLVVLRFSLAVLFLTLSDVVREVHPRAARTAHGSDLVGYLLQDSILSRLRESTSCDALFAHLVELLSSPEFDFSSGRPGRFRRDVLCDLLTAAGLLQHLQTTGTIDSRKVIFDRLLSSITHGTPADAGTTEGRSAASDALEDPSQHLVELLLKRGHRGVGLSKTQPTVDLKAVKVLLDYVAVSSVCELEQTALFLLRPECLRVLAGITGPTLVEGARHFVKTMLGILSRYQSLGQGQSPSVARLCSLLTMLLITLLLEGFKGPAAGSESGCSQMDVYLFDTAQSVVKACDEETLRERVRWEAVTGAAPRESTFGDVVVDYVAGLINSCAERGWGMFRTDFVRRLYLLLTVLIKKRRSENLSDNLRTLLKVLLEGYLNPPVLLRKERLCRETIEAMLDLFREVESSAAGSGEFTCWSTIWAALFSNSYPPQLEALGPDAGYSELDKTAIFRRRKGIHFGWGADPLVRLGAGLPAPYDSAAKGIGRFCHLGLENAGCTCYMNAMLQQVFMVPGFAEAVWAALAEQSREGEGGESKNGSLSPREDNVVKVLSRLFLRMRLSHVQYVKMRGFIKSLSKAMQTRIDPTEQQDAQEFGARLLDTIESSSKGTHLHDFLKKGIGGAFLQSVKCNTCETRSTRREEFYFLSLTVEGHSSLQEALSELVRPELLTKDNQYSCDKCEAKRDGLRTTAFDALPRTLFIHLKRFTYDVVLQARSKINDRFVFPMEMTLSSEGETDGPSQRVTEHHYECVGVVIHEGTADSGHYFSFIKDRAGPSRADAKKRRWHLFNDANVSTTTPDKFLNAQAFGGRNGIAQSAYVLVYERCQQTASTEDKKPVSLVDGHKLLSSDSTCRSILVDSLTTHLESVLFHDGFAAFVLDLYRTTEKKGASGLANLVKASESLLRYLMVCATHPVEDKATDSTGKKSPSELRMREELVPQMWAELSNACQSHSDVAAHVFGLLSRFRAGSSSDLTAPDFHMAVQNGFSSGWAHRVLQIMTTCFSHVAPNEALLAGSGDPQRKAAKRRPSSHFDEFLSGIWNRACDDETKIETRLHLLRFLQRVCKERPALRRYLVSHDVLARVVISFAPTDVLRSIDSLELTSESQCTALTEQLGVSVANLRLMHLILRENPSILKARKTFRTGQDLRGSAKNALQAALCTIDILGDGLESPDAYGSASELLWSKLFLSSSLGQVESFLSLPGIAQAKVRQVFSGAKGPVSGGIGKPRSIRLGRAAYRTVLDFLLRTKEASSDAETALIEVLRAAVLGVRDPAKGAMEQYTFFNPQEQTTFWTPIYGGLYSGSVSSSARLVPAVCASILIRVDTSLSASFMNTVTETFEKILLEVSGETSDYEASSHRVEAAKAVGRVMQFLRCVAFLSRRRVHESLWNFCVCAADDAVEEGDRLLGRLVSVCLLQHRLPCRSAELAKDASAFLRLLMVDTAASDRRQERPSCGSERPSKKRRTQSASGEDASEQSPLWWVAMNIPSMDVVTRSLAREVAKASAEDIDGDALDGEEERQLSERLRAQRLSPEKCQFVLEQVLEVFLGVTDQQDDVMDLVEADEMSTWAALRHAVSTGQGAGRSDFDNQHLVHTVRLLQCCLAQLLEQTSTEVASDGHSRAGDESPGWSRSRLAEKLTLALGNIFLILEFLKEKERRLDHDRFRGELYSFLLQVFVAFPELRGAFLTSSITSQRSQDLCYEHFTYRPSCKENISFNEKYMPFYYGLMYLIVSHEQAAATVVGDEGNPVAYPCFVCFHDNVRWATSTFIVQSVEYPRVAVVMLAFLSACLSSRPLAPLLRGDAAKDFWMKIARNGKVERALAPSAYDAQTGNLDRSLRTLQLARLLTSAIGYHVDRSYESITGRILSYASQVAVEATIGRKVHNGEADRSRYATPHFSAGHASEERDEAVEECVSMLGYQNLEESWDEEADNFDLQALVSALMSRIRLQKLCEAMQVALILAREGTVVEKLAKQFGSNQFKLPRFIVRALQNHLELYTGRQRVRPVIAASRNSARFAESTFGHPWVWARSLLECTISVGAKHLTGMISNAKDGHRKETPEKEATLDKLCSSAYELFCLPLLSAHNFLRMSLSDDPTETFFSKDSLPWEQGAFVELGDLQLTSNSSVLILAEKALKILVNTAADTEHAGGFLDSLPMLQEGRNPVPGSRTVGLFLVLSFLVLRMETFAIIRAAQKVPTRDDEQSDAVRGLQNRLGRWHKCLQTLHVLLLHWRDRIHGESVENSDQWMSAFMLIMVRDAVVPFKDPDSADLKEWLLQRMSNLEDDPAKLDGAIVRASIYAPHSGYVPFLKMLRARLPMGIGDINLAGTELLRLRRSRPFSYGFAVLLNEEVSQIIAELKGILTPCIESLREQGQTFIEAERTRLAEQAQQQQAAQVIDVEAFVEEQHQPGGQAIRRSLSVLVFYGLSLILLIVRAKFKDEHMDNMRLPPSKDAAGVKEDLTAVLLQVWPLVQQVNSLTDLQERVFAEMQVQLFWDVDSLNKVVATTVQLRPELAEEEGVVESKNGVYEVS